MHKRLSIGSVALENGVILAPLAGITNLPFRQIAKRSGCGLVYSEMISAAGLVHRAQKTMRMLASQPEEKPLAVQIFGADPPIMAEAAKIVENSGADILDINFGCSVKKILKTGSGAALMRDPQQAEKLLKSIRSAVKIPVSIKIRTGWDRSGGQALILSKIAEASGVDAIAVHPRTANQGFSGKADWSIIARVKKEVKIPVIGNGDIFGPKDALKMISETECDGVMIGRAAIGNPWIISQVLAGIANVDFPPVSFRKRFEVMMQYLDASVRYCGEENACYMLRSRLGWFSKGLPHSSQFRDSIKHISSRGEAAALISAYQTIVETFAAERIKQA
ncbi:MAG: tRNA dihydrouridine synthase DusB [Desulfobacterales bacterium]